MEQAITLQKWKDRAIKRAVKEMKESTARTLLEIGKLTLEEIAVATRLKLKRVKKLAEAL